MFRTFRNFPRITDKSNVVAEPQTVVYVADGIADGSTGAWISPQRTVTTDDGTFRIGLMNPFAGAVVTNATGGGGDPCIWQFGAQVQSLACISSCSECNCAAAMAAANAKIPDGQQKFENFTCGPDNPTPDGNGNCTLECTLSGGSGLSTIFLQVPCFGVAEYNCNPDSGQISIPPHEISTIVRQIERFILDLDITQIKDVDPNSINSAILRLPIKSKSDWM
jgi:hypothetical protein